MEDKRNKNIPQSLSKKEKARAAKAAQQLKTAVHNGYKIKEITISPLFANIMAFVWGTLFSIPMFVTYYLYNGYFFGGPESTTFDIFAFFFVDLILIVVHEGIHGIFMYLFNGHDKTTIEFGINSGMPYCTCQSPIKKWQYFIVLIMPTMIIGTVMSIVAVLTGRFIWLMIGFVIIAGGGGDFTICAKILPCKEKDLCIVDHPYKCGFFALSKKYNNDDAENVIDELEQVASEAPTIKKKKTLKTYVKFFLIGAFIGLFLAGVYIGYDIGRQKFAEESTNTTSITETVETSDTQQSKSAQLRAFLIFKNNLTSN